MKVGVVVFPGSNCDRDMYRVLSDVFNLRAEYFWHDDSLPRDLDAVVLPGGFSYGDRLRSGAIAAHSPVISDIRRMSERGTPVLGVCNGFQILVESGLLPGALLKNASLNFMCGWTDLVVENNRTPFTSELGRGQRIPIPIANAEGRYYADDATLRELRRGGQIVFRYDGDVNGSVHQIAGVCNKEGNVVGMMPHPERAAEAEINPVDHRPSSKIFESLLSTAGVER